MYTYYFIHIFYRDKNNTPVTHFCETIIIISVPLRFENAVYDYDEVECLCCLIMPALSAMFGFNGWGGRGHDDFVPGEVTKIAPSGDRTT